MRSPAPLTQLSIVTCMCCPQVDQPDMIAFKGERLHVVGAPTGSAQAAAGRARHPLKAASWAGVAADLTDPDWPHALFAAGFSAGAACADAARDAQGCMHGHRSCAGCLGDAAGLCRAALGQLRGAVTDACCGRCAHCVGCGGPHVLPSTRRQRRAAQDAGVSLRARWHAQTACMHTSARPQVATLLLAAAETALSVHMPATVVRAIGQILRSVRV